MEIAILDFIEYLRKTKHSSLNTEVSYERDLRKLCRYLEEKYDILCFQERRIRPDLFSLSAERGQNQAESRGGSEASEGGEADA